MSRWWTCPGRAMSNRSWNTESLPSALRSGQTGAAARLFRLKGGSVAAAAPLRPTIAVNWMSQNGGNGNGAVGRPARWQPSVRRPLASPSQAETSGSPQRGRHFWCNYTEEEEGYPWSITVGNTSCFREFYTCFGCETKTGVRVLVIFQDRPMFSHIIQKVSAKAFHWCGWA